MSESILLSRFRKLNYTPLRDLIRGRVTGRLDLILAIEGADLPEPCKALVRRLIRGTRLWRMEKCQVAAELVAHFKDGLESGESIEQLIASFGDERSAAKLIRRAKIRNRSLIWHFYRAVHRGIAACLVFYALAALYFFTGRPSPSVDYIAVLNRPTEQIPPDQRAWPIYRDLHLTFYDHSDEKAVERFKDMVRSRPGDANDPQLMSWLENHQRELDTIRTASAKPALGIIFAADGISGQPLLSSNWSFALPPLGTPTVVAAYGPYQQIVEQEAELLCGDVTLAARSSDPSRIIHDIADASRIADQLRQMQSINACHTAISVRDSILSRINDVLVEHPEIFRDEDLVQIAHIISKPSTRAELMTYEGFRIVFEDTIQRMYTNSALGLSHLTPVGVEAMTSNARRMGAEFMWTKAAIPMFIIAGPSRSQSSREANHSVDLAEAGLNRPFREVAASYSPVDYRKLMSNPLTYARNLPLAINSTLPMHQAHAERYLGHRDGILIGIALESYRRHHDGSYPTLLSQLQPALIPSLPEDRITGEPLHYRLMDGKPLIYSVGADQDDDGGKLCVVEKDDPRPSAGPDMAAAWIKPTSARDGDWVLYPQPRVIDPDEQK